ncbi:MAG TPA: UTP--glucose-1-phosphate uridylyltransferase, partial [Bryobacteraceae bacterium]|nr:UTP--glucose-1-phosphate uridylyltransferase [Bryobacteraceae bacterium]
MNELVRIITSRDAGIRNRSLDAIARPLDATALIEECDALDRFRRVHENLYERVRAQFFLYAIHRFHLPYRQGMNASGRIPFAAHRHLLERRFEEAIDLLLRAQGADGASAALSSGLAAAYRGLGFQTLANQVRRSVRSVRGNQWLARTGHPADYPLAIRPELVERDAAGLFPILREATPVRMDLSHSGWSDIFFLGMDFPEGARVLNVSIDLAVRGASNGAPQPPVEAHLRVIDEPVLRLASVDLGAVAELTSFAEVFDFARDYLGLLKAAVIASGLVPQALEGAGQPLADLLAKLTGQPGRGVEIVSRVNDIPKGSRLAVSTTLLGCLISACMRATGQIHDLTGSLTENDRRTVAARAILGEWLGGSGGGWQDSGGLWPGMKLIQGVEARASDPEFGVSRGCLLPCHHVLSFDEVTAATRERLEQSLVLVHGGMAQDVGPILEMVTEKYLLRSEAEWKARLEAMGIFDEIVAGLRNGAVDALGSATERNFFGPLQTIIPWATNYYTETLIRAVRAEFGEGFQGFWMLGGMSGGGMGFLFAPEKKRAAQERLQAIMSETKRRLEGAMAFAMEPVVYDFAINERGSEARLDSGDAGLMPAGYYTLTVPALLRVEPRLLPRARRTELGRFGEACRREPLLAGTVERLFDRLIPQSNAENGTSREGLRELLDRFGFDREQHDQIQADLRAGRIGLAQNRLPTSTQIEDAASGDVAEAAALRDHHRRKGADALAAGEVAVVSLAGGAGSRWTRGAGVVKALNPFAKLGGRHRNFIEVHLAKSRRTAQAAGAALPHIITTSYLTHEPIEAWLREERNYDYPGPLLLSQGRAIGLRLVPTARDLRFAWEELAQQMLDEQAQKVRESLHAALIHWAESTGEASDYTDNLPMQCLHPVGHWYEVPNLLRNGVLARLLAQRPGLRHIMVHNIDTLGADVDAAILGYHVEQGAAITTEVIARHIDDRGGGLARIGGRVRLVEGLALPNEEIESALSYYNSNTMWIAIDPLLEAFGLARKDLDDDARVA